MAARRQTSRITQRSRRIASDVSFCIAKIAGKYAAYPDVDPDVFERVHSALESGLERCSPSGVDDYCQELRAVTSCPPAELLRFSGADETDSRLAAIAQVVRERALLKDDLFRELLTGLLSWERSDKAAILEALTGIVRG